MSPPAASSPAGPLSPQGGAGREGCRPSHQDPGSASWSAPPDIEAALAEAGAEIVVAG
jgi:hypothetical protein